MAAVATPRAGLRVDPPRRRVFPQEGRRVRERLVAYVPDEDLTVVVLCNTDGEAAMQIADAMAGLVLGAPDARTLPPGR